MPLPFKLRLNMLSLSTETHSYLWGALIAAVLLLFSRNPYWSVGCFFVLLFCICGFIKRLWYESPGKAILLVGGLGLLLWGNGYWRLAGAGLVALLVRKVLTIQSTFPVERPVSNNQLGKRRWATADDFVSGSASSLLWDGNGGAIRLGCHPVWQTTPVPPTGQKNLLSLSRKKLQRIQRPALLAFADAGHSMAFGGTRSGKGVNLVIPNAIHYGHSLVALDPKGGEIFLRSVYARRQQQQPVAVLDPMGLCAKEARKLVQQLHHQANEVGLTEADRLAAQSYFETLATHTEYYGEDHFRRRYNPLGYCETLQKRKQTDLLLAYINILTELIVVPDAHQTDTSWARKSRNLLKDMILYLLYSDRLARKRTDYPVSLPTAIRVLREVTTGDRMIDLFRQECAANNVLHRLGVGDSLNPVTVGEKERPTIIGDLLNVHCQFMDFNGVADSLSSGDELDPDTLYTDPQSIYLIFSPDLLDGPLRGLARLWLGSLLAVAKLDQSGLAPERPALFLIDEAASLRRMDIIETNLATSASYGVKLMLIFQNIGQIKQHYPNRADNTFFANTAVQVYLGVTSNDLETTHYLSQVCGKRTQRLVEDGYGQSISEGRTRGSSSSYGPDSYSGGSQHSSTRTVTHDNKSSERFVEVDLLPADEVAQCVNETPLMFSTLVDYPVRLTRTPYYFSDCQERYPFWLPTPVLRSLQL